MKSGVAAKSLEQESLRLDAELDSPEKLGRCTALVALFGVVQEPGLVVQLLLSQETGTSNEFES